MPGTRFFNCDLHIHTPISPCYKDNTVTSEMIIKEVIEKKLDVIAITDHNSNEGIEGVRNALNGTNIIVLPGVEITAEGGHILALFDEATEISKIDDLLTSCGITKENRGKEQAIGKPFSDVIDIIVNDYAGIAIAAHADCKKGFLTTIDQGQSRIKIYKNPNLSAMELCDLQQINKYIEGKDPNYSRKLAVIQSSDAHSIAEIGFRTTLIKMDKPSIFGLKLAFNDPILRIKFPDSWTEVSYPYIKSLKVSQGFLSGQIFEFNRSLNCLLGGAGSGKSTIIEFLRFVFDQLSDIDDIRKDCNGKLVDLAGTGSVFEAEFVNKNGEELIIERTFNNDDNPIRLKKKNDGVVLESINIRDYFPVFAYSQGEAIIISKNPLAQLDLIDKHLPIQDLINNIEESYEALDSQINTIIQVKSIVDDKHENKKNISTNNAVIKRLSEELNLLTSVQKEPVFETHQLWKTEEDFFNSYKINILSTKSWIMNYFKDLEIPLLLTEEIEEVTPNKELINTISKRNLEISEVFSAAQKSALGILDEIDKKYSVDVKKWQELFQSHQAEYERLAKECDEKRIDEINNELDGLRKKANKLLTKKREIELSEKQLTLEMRARQQVIQLIKTTKERVFETRDKYIKQINKLIPELRISLVPNRIYGNYKFLLQEALKGSRCKEQTLDEVCNTINPYDLVQILIDKDLSRFQNVLDLGDWNERIINQFDLRKEYIYRLESLHVEDFLQISFKVDDKNYKPLEKLSTGQKATVIVLLSMLDGISPIIFDQPEDALYTPFIYSSVVKLVRQSKENRQYIFATHNSNIAVATGLDLGIVLESTSSSTSIDSFGGLDDSKTNELVVLHLEGGEEAINDRMREYRFTTHKKPK